MKLKSFFLIAMTLALSLTVSWKATASEVNNHEQSAVVDVGKSCFDASVLNNVVINDISVCENIVYPKPEPAIVNPVYRYEKRKFVSYNKKLNRQYYQQYGMAMKQKVKNKVITTILKVNARNQLTWVKREDHKIIEEAEI